MRFRRATRADVPAIARLHAESWRANYRGAYRDDYLDGDIEAERLRVWRERFDPEPAHQLVVLAEEDGDGLVGFACVHGGDDPRWGSLLDNLHVQPGQQSRGVGAALMAEVCAWCREHFPDAGLYLWVLVGNRRGQAFYRRLGAEDAGGEDSVPPGGGRIHGRRYAWKTLPELPRAVDSPDDGGAAW